MRADSMGCAARAATIAFALATPAAVAVAAGVGSDLSAIVSYENRLVLTSGVTRIDTWQERLVRRDGQVWIERVLPAAKSATAEHESPEEHADHIGHRHFNAETAARWLTRGANGEPQLKFVDHVHKAVISIPRAEYGTVGFDGSFDAAASIVPAALVHRMKAIGSGAGGDMQWHSERGDGWSYRVLWSERQQLAMRVESRRIDGSASRTISVRLVPRDAIVPAPWTRVTSYAQKQYDDYMD